MVFGVNAAGRAFWRAVGATGRDDIVPFWLPTARTG